MNFLIDYIGDDMFLFVVIALMDIVLVGNALRVMGVFS